MNEKKTKLRKKTETKRLIFENPLTKPHLKTNLTNHKGKTMTGQRWTTISIHKIEDQKGDEVEMLSQHDLLADESGEQFVILSGDGMRTLQISITDDEVVLFDPETETVFGKAKRLLEDEDPKTQSVESDAQGASDSFEAIKTGLDDVIIEAKDQIKSTTKGIQAFLEKTITDAQKALHEIQVQEKNGEENINTVQTLIETALADGQSHIQNIKDKTKLPEFENEEENDDSETGPSNT